ncbi:MAG TPA: plastocyanin/azurin family copper-binding protein [Chloroflexota bacterium]
MRRLTSAVVAMALVAAWAALPARAQDSGARWDVLVGRETDDHAIQGQAFFPMVITVVAGDTIRWTLGGQYSHTVTFLSRQAGPVNPILTPDGRSIVNPLVEYAQGGTTYDGTRYANSGILSARADNYDLTFSTPGVYPYLCLIHRGMDGTVVVLPSGTQPPKTAAEYRGLGEREWAVVRERGEGLAQSAPTVTEPVPGDAVNYYISSGFGGNEASVLRFLPEELTVHVGDTVTWVQSDPQEVHTVTFPDADSPTSLTTVDTPPFGPPVTVLDPQATQLQGGPVHRGVGYYNSGVMQPFARYTLTFLQPGTYSYICIRHANLGQIGTIVVQP